MMKTNQENTKHRMYLTVALQLALILSLSITTSAGIGQTQHQIIEQPTTLTSLALGALKLFTKIIGDNNIVSAQSTNARGKSTCPLDNEGNSCQEYPSDTCDDLCSGPCLPLRRDETELCKLGTCYNPHRGICTPQTSRTECLTENGEWHNDEEGNIRECQVGCCIIGNNPHPLVTQRECAYLGETFGIEVDYQGQIRTEIGCIAQTRSKVLGACRFEIGNGNECRFLTQEQCIADKGNFHEGLLCSNPSLETDLTAQATARCENDKLYWYDSEGNRENIYDANKPKSWNNGFVQNPEESCKIGNQNNPLANSATCGNCNRYQSSVCKEKTGVRKLSDNSIDFVCQDLSCNDENGKQRENGESWCVYQSRIGEQSGSASFTRSADVPGSRHYRSSCVDGEIQTNPCADYRNQVCAEEELIRTIDNALLTNAQCISNPWQECFDYNTPVTDSDNRRPDELIETRNLECNDNPLCYLKRIDVDTQYKLDICVPTVPPGFNLDTNTEGAETACSLGNKECNVLYEKTFTGWKCLKNCACLKSGFAEQMNDLCLSLGDCGASSNLNGDVTENYQVQRTPRLKQSYLDNLREYSTPKQNEHLTIELPPTNRNNLNDTSELLGTRGPYYSGGKAPLRFAGPNRAIVRTFGKVISQIYILRVLSVFFTLLGGVGETKTRIVSFTCNPWQAPRGGDACSECGAEGQPCTVYACKSLGQTCKLINEGTKEETCENISPHDITNPTILGGLTSELSENARYTKPTENGMQLESKDVSGCFRAFEEISYGIQISEHAQCVYTFEHTQSYEEMISHPTAGIFGTGLYLPEHTQTLALPGFTHLGINGYDPTTKIDLNFHIRCVDANGNGETGKEYLINLCLVPGKDGTEPVVTGHTPPQTEVAHGTESHTTIFYLNEPSTCRWSEENIDYTQMTNDLECQTEPERRSHTLGWDCTTTLPLTQDEQTYYLSCRDQPWYARDYQGEVEPLPAGNETERNQMNTNYAYTLTRSQNALTIDNITPLNETLLFGTSPATVKIELTTSGGQTDTTQCSLQGEPLTQRGNTHFITFNQIQATSYRFQLLCEDDLGNRDEASSTFNVELDTTPPKIVRAYNQAGDLVIITDEPATCSSHTNINCQGTGTNMNSGDKKHTTPLTEELTHISCQDTWGNRPGSCSITVKT